jgi:uncharacterized membrane protein YadS
MVEILNQREVNLAEVEASTKTNKTLKIFIGFVLVIILAILAHWLKLKVYNAKLPLNIPGKVLEYPLWAGLVGLSVNWILKKLKVYEWLRPGFRTELFLKMGLVLLGATISFRTIVTAASGAIIQALIMVTCVYFFAWWLAGKFKLPDTLRAVMSAAVSICGVSAAIATAGSVSAKKEEVSYITTLVIITALPLMVLAPVAASWMGMPDAVAGAWFGGNIDTTAAVVGAGTIFSANAQKIASIVKQAQNTLIGIVAFLLAVYFVAKSKGEKAKPSILVIWQRFPKFVLGFILASLIATFGLINTNAGSVISSMKDWLFCLAFVSMGLEVSASGFREMGWRPLIVYLIVTIFNTLLALGVSWLIFGFLLPPVF